MGKLKTRWNKMKCESCGKILGYTTKNTGLYLCEDCLFRQNKGVWLG